MGGKKEVQWKYDELPTPTNEAEMMEVLEKEKQVRLDWMNGTADDGWNDYATIDDVKIEVLTIPDSAIYVVRANGILKNVNMDAVFDAYLHGGMEERRKVNNDIASHEMLFQVETNEECYVTYDSFNTPVGIANREFVCLRNKEQNPDGSHFVVVQSINWEPKPVQSGHVRGTMRSGRLFKPLEDGNWHMTIVDHVEPRGKIPSFVVNMFIKKAAEIFRKMEKVYTKQ